MRLSGGLDSSTVAAVARRHGALSAYSAVFPDDADADESELIDLLVDQLELEGARSVVSGGRVIAGGLSYLRTWLVPSTSPNSYLWLPLLTKAAQDGVDLMLDGEGGDEVFDARPFYVFADLVRQGRVTAAWTMTRRYPGVTTETTRRHRARILAHFVRRGLTPHVLQRLRGRLPGRPGTELLERGDLRRAAELEDPWSWKRLDGPLWWRFKAHSLTTMRELVDAPGTLRRHAVLAGLRDGHPLMLDQSLVELALRLPPESGFDPSVDRPLARAAMAGSLPDAVRLRRGKSHFSNQVRDSLLGPDRPLVDALLGDPRARVRSYVRSHYLDDALLAADPGARHPGGAHAWAAETWRVAAVECWLRQLEDRSFAGELAERTADEPTLRHRVLGQRASLH